jgi:hypothetical protein
MKDGGLKERRENLKSFDDFFPKTAMHDFLFKIGSTSYKK